MRYVTMLGLVLILAVGLGERLHAKSLDVDGDGATDNVDNCVLLQNANGDTSPGSACGDQEDGDMDGYGNTCDSDINNNGATDLGDVSLVLVAAIQVSTVLNTDLNCNGAADLADVSRALAEAAIVLVPGPSGYACAGTTPCP